MLLLRSTRFVDESTTLTPMLLWPGAIASDATIVNPSTIVSAVILFATIAVEAPAITLTNCGPRFHAGGPSNPPKRLTPDTSTIGMAAV
jgi:hypothetical protein